MTVQETLRPISSEPYHETEFPMRRETAPMRRRDQGGDNSTMLMAGLAIVGLGALAWFYLGKDVMRYIRIETM